MSASALLTLLGALFGQTTQQNACGVPLTSLYSAACPNTTALGYPSLNTCCNSSALTVLYDTTIQCSDSDAVMLVRSLAFDNVTYGYYFARTIMCGTSEGLSSSYWYASAPWNQGYKFNPQVDQISCMTSSSNLRNIDIFRRATCTSDITPYYVTPVTDCPVDFTVLDFYSPRTNTSSIIGSTLASQLSTGCNRTNNKPYVAESNYPASTLRCFGSLFLIRGTKVIQGKVIECRTTGLKFFAIDESLFSLANGDRVFCTDPIIESDFECPKLISPLNCPTTISSFTSDFMPIPYYQASLIATPNCSIPYVIEYGGFNGGMIDCYKNSVSEENRQLILVSDVSGFHLTRSLRCDRGGHTLDESSSKAFQPGAEFTCIDTYEAFKTFYEDQQGIALYEYDSYEYY